MQPLEVSSHILSFLPFIKCLLNSHHVPGGGLGTKEMNKPDPTRSSRGSSLKRQNTSDHLLAQVQQEER